MASQSEQLEQDAEDARRRLQTTLAELHARAAPGAFFDRAIDSVRRGFGGESFGNLARDVRENPMPLVLIGIGILWLSLSRSRSARALIRNVAGSVSRKAAEIGTATSSMVRKRTADLGAAAGALAERAHGVSAMTAVVVLGKEEWPLTGAPEGGRLPEAMAARDERRPTATGEGTAERS
jgi:hypothetical protein